MGAAGSITAQSDLNIVNTALLRMGQAPIEAFGQFIGTAQVTQAAYNTSRDGLLRLQPWNFARAWTPLTMLDVVPVNLDIIPEAAAPGVIVFTYAYKLPLNCLRVYRFAPKDAHWRQIGRTLLTDAAPAQVRGQLLGTQTPSSNDPFNSPSSSGPTGIPNSVGIEYVRLVEDCTQWDSLFTNAFIWKLCLELSFGITGLMQQYTMAKQEYTDALQNAAMVNGIENWADPFWNTDLNNVRYGYVGVTIEGY
jgi:hypothetical protein